MIAWDDHLRRVRAVVDEIIWRLNGDFTALFPPTGQAPIPTERLLTAQVLMIEIIRGWRHLMRHSQCDSLYC